MSIKVVRGLIGNDLVSERSSKPVDVAKASTANISAAVTATPYAVNSEAVVTSVRSSRPVASTERIREEKEAKNVAREVADNIREDSRAIDAHSDLSESAGACL